MMTSLLIGLSILSGQTPAQVSPDLSRYYLGIRYQRLESAWMDQKQKTVRATVIGDLDQAVQAFFQNKSEVGNQALDEATVGLTKSALYPEWALNGVAFPPAIEPGGDLQVNLSWAYKPNSVLPVPIQIGDEERDLEPGMRTTWTIPASMLAKMGFRNEGDYTFRIQAREVTIPISFSIVRDGAARLQALQSSQQPQAVEIGKMLDVAQAGAFETVPPFFQQIKLGEQLIAAPESMAQVQDWYYSRHQGTAIRAWFPRNMTDETPVVIALHGAGASPNMWFDAYGKGRAVSLAKKRQWAIVAPQTGSVTSLRAALDFVRVVRGVEPRRFFLIGHSMGGGVAVSALRAGIRPMAAALLAPAATSIPFTETPIYMATGADDRMTGRMAEQLQKELAKNDRAVSVTIPNCEHLMVVPDSLDDVFKFFDKAKRQFKE